MPRFYLTTAIDYVNSRPHLGTAYEKITADIIARYKRLAGVPTHFVMGNDEHSQNVYRRARELGLDALAYCDQMEREFRDVWGRLDISFDDFIRTTEPRHRAGVTEITRRIHEAGDIYEGVYEGWYCIGCEAFKQEKDLVDGNCPIHLTRPEWITEKNYFFRLSKYRPALLEHFRAHPEFLEPEIRRNEIVRLLESGLEDISISRAGQPWGIPLPFDADSVVYVWFDALINYVSAVGYGTDPPLFERWWPADLHVIGKDITRFHCVIWPAMLMSARLPLPRQVFGHGFMSFSGQRMSKSLGTAIDPVEAAARFGADPLRLYLAKEIPFGGDGDFSWERYDERYNVDLANNLGNLVSRVAAMADRYRQGRLPAAGTSGRLAGAAAETVQRYRSAMERYALDEAAVAVFDLLDATNEFIAATEPWAIAKRADQAERLSDVLHDAAEAVRVAAVLLLPIMPRSAAEILRRMGERKQAADVRLDDAAWSSRERLVVKADPLWPRVEAVPAVPAGATPVTREQKTMSSDQPAGSTPEQPSSAAQQSSPASPSPAGVVPGPVTQAVVAEGAGEERLSIDEFSRVDLRVAKILAAEKVKGSKKLVRMQIDLGTEQRQIVAGIAEAYAAESLVGRSIVVVANLKPAKLMGVESNGMLLAASAEGGRPILIGFPDEAPQPGTKIK